MKKGNSTRLFCSALVVPLKKKQTTKQATKQTAKQTKKSKVRFGRNSYKLFLRDLSPEEAEQVWYKAEDYMAIRSNIHEDLREVFKFRQRHSMDHLSSQQNDISLRGLEHHMNGKMNVKRERRRYYVQYLLHTQKYMKVTNPAELRAFSLSLSSQDQRRAQHFAAFDAMEAYKVHKESALTIPSLEEDYPEFTDIPRNTGLKTRCCATEDVVVPITVLSS